MSVPTKPLLYSTHRLSCFDHPLVPGSRLYCYATSILFVVVVLGAVASWSGFPLLFRRYFKEELLVTLATCSTEAVLPRMMAKLERLGCGHSVVGLVLGYTFNADGTSIYRTMAAVFAAAHTVEVVETQS
jgi:aerobic C4-dicarboxylate transport protein